MPGLCDIILLASMITRRIARPLGAISSTTWTCPACVRHRAPTTQCDDTNAAGQSRISSSPTLQRQKPVSLQRRNLSSTRNLAAARGPGDIPILPHHTSFSKQGVPGLFSKSGYNLAWIEYQTMIQKKLAFLVAGESISGEDPKSMAVQFARDPNNASLFNHASMAHNNHFFFQTLAVKPTPLEHMPPLQKSLEDTFGSIETLRTTMLDTAAAMFGPGFVWLVWDRDAPPTGLRRGQWRILTTYLAGTPYPEAGYRQQGLDMNTQNVAGFNEYQSRQPVGPVGSFGNWSASGREHSSIPPGGTRLMPVLCVSTWEHTYIYDYGLAGKGNFLQDWWAAVDWYQVDHRVPSEAKSTAFG